MNRFEELIKSVSAMPSVILHLGAGACSDYEFYNTLNPDQVIFVEPDQNLAEAATDTFINTSRVQVIPRAVAATNGRQILNITNNRRFSSLLLPGELLDFYPNITVDQNVEIEAITLTRLCRNQKINKESENLLVAELQGVEKEVFPLAEIEMLQKFKWIIIRSSKTNLYAPASGIAQTSLSEVMQDAGFMVLVFEEDAPPFINILCIRNDAGIENTRLKTQEADLLNTIRVLEHNLAKQTADLGALKTNHAAAIAELQLSLNSRSGELGRAKSLIRTTIVEKENQQQQLAMQTDALKEKEKEISGMQQTLRINNKLILKSDADLRDLQLQYRAALQHQEQQHNLLSELKEKLQQASAFYQKLNLQNLVIDGGLLEQDGPDGSDSGSDDEHE